MKVSRYFTCLCTLAMLAVPVVAQESSPATESKSEKTKDAFDKAGEATKHAMKKAGEATEKGLEAAGKGTGAAVEHTGRGVTKAGKATAHAMADSAEAVADFFDGDKDRNADDIREVQTTLQSKGYYSGPVDGVVGPKTRASVSEFQKDENLPVTGKVDAKTKERLGVK